MRFDASALEAERQDKDNFFKRHPHSPLTPDQKKAFTGLDYYPPNPSLALELQAEPFDPKETVQIQTSTGDVKSFVRWGKITFPVNGEQVSLSLFFSPSSGHFFLPFKDATSGTETYGAGRYLDPEHLGQGRFWVDFNVAYSPYCAYNSHWNCPLTPAENVLRVRIEAGEKKPSSTWAEAY